MIENPPIPMLKRKKINDEEATSNGFNVTARNQLESVAFVLKRSGKVIRKVESAPPINLRNWKPVGISNNNIENVEEIPEQSLICRQIAAETVYALKPLAHLLSVYRFGDNTWKPWALSLMIDLISLHLHKISETSGDFVKLSPKQQLQISRRYFSLLLYLLKSPFYDKYTKERLNNFLLGFCQKIPLARLIAIPLAKYIPHWQRTYFYMWST